MSHANARLTVRGRLLIVERARAGWKQAHIASAMGVSTCVALASNRITSCSARPSLSVAARAVGAPAVARAAKAAMSGSGAMRGEGRRK